MNTVFFTSTLCQVRADMTHQTAFVTMIAVGLFLGISRPFETLQMLPLIALSTKDRYVRFETTKGHDMILMHLSDAIKAVSCNFDRGKVTFLSDSTRPINRSYLPAVKEAGLLPKRHG